MEINAICKITDDIVQKYSSSISNISPVNGGWLNEKWCADIVNRKILIKQFSNQRYSPDRVETIEKALKIQMAAYIDGVECPCIYLSNDKIIQTLSNNIWYMVMDFSNGHMESPDTITKIQINSLGEECAKMHRFLVPFRAFPKELLLGGYPKGEIRLRRSVAR